VGDNKVKPSIVRGSSEVVMNSKKTKKNKVNEFKFLK
jgi:hypothetical protein